MSETTVRDLRRTEIVTVARDLFSRKGYHGTTIPDIARAAGISTGLIYYIFSSKEDILLASCEGSTSYLLDVFERTRDIAHPLERFDAIVRDLYTSLDKGSKQLIIVYKDISTLQRPTRQRILSLVKSFDTHFMQLFEEGQRAGIFSPNIPEPRVLAASVLGLGHLWALQKTWHFAPQISLDAYISAQLAYFHAQLLEGVADTTPSHELYRQAEKISSDDGQAS
ncbi:MAG TPA: TetR/AcrR family transcriptional regulator [Ktedonobacteraceae bacterium]|jgi:AcrR family transcriptional regulator|nr:TetR/AcrR family transcriptional regulator [Ktedonobacteraceae bacterium]